MPRLHPINLLKNFRSFVHHRLKGPLFRLFKESGFLFLHFLLLFIS